MVVSLGILIEVRLGFDEIVSVPDTAPVRLGKLNVKRFVLDEIVIELEIVFRFVAMIESILL